MLEKQKADLRKEIRGQLRLLPEEEKEILDRQIAERVLTLPAVTDAGAVYGYASLNWETGTAEILKELWKKKCIVCLPRVMGETISLRARFTLWSLRTDAGAQRSTIRK